MFRNTVFQIIVCCCVAIPAGLMRPAYVHSEEPAEKGVRLQSGLYYTVQNGDTLWDISEHFYDSPWVWPDLWERNQKIVNPHWINPGERIRLFTREELETFGQPEAEPEPEMTAPPQEPPYYYYPSINSVGFIRKKAVTASGTIFKVKEDKVMISQRDMVYVRPLGEMTFEPGDRFTVLRTLEPLKDKDTEAVIGIQHYILGVVEIKAVEPKFCIATVVQSFRHIKVNDLLIPHEPRSPKITLTGSKEGLKGSIIAAEEHQGMFADTIVFIDKGCDDGVEVGQSYAIYYQEKEYLDPKTNESILLSPVDFGKILILRTEATTATALVTKAEKAIHPGATIRALSH